MMQRRATGEGFAKRRHRNGGQAARGAALHFDRLLQSEPIHNGGEHADRIRARAFDPGVGPLYAPEKIPAADDDRDLVTIFRRRRQVLCDALQRPRVEPMRGSALQSLSGELNDHAF